MARKTPKYTAISRARTPANPQTVRSVRKSAKKGRQVTEAEIAHKKSKKRQRKSENRAAAAARSSASRRRSSSSRSSSSRSSSSSSSSSGLSRWFSRYKK